MKLVGAAADNQQRRVAIISLDTKIFRVARAPVNPQRLERDLRATLQEPNVVHSFALAGAGGAYGTVALDLDAKRGAVPDKRRAPLSGGNRPGQIATYAMVSTSIID